MITALLIAKVAKKYSEQFREINNKSPGLLSLCAEKWNSPNTLLIDETNIRQDKRIIWHSSEQNKHRGVRSLMKIYNLKRTQFLPISLEAAWEFFSSPANLEKITPAKMAFNILYKSGGDKMYAGQLIRYRVKILSFLSVHWVTEITHVEKPFYFVDEQRFGPYSIWHHQHHFASVDGGVLMTDEVNYGVPLGFIGRLTHWLFVGRKVNAIFEHRFNVLERYFQEPPVC